MSMFVCDTTVKLSATLPEGMTDTTLLENEVLELAFNIHMLIPAPVDRLYILLSPDVLLSKCSNFCPPPCFLAELH